jgi:myo-inositol-1(or 4)-monophosphatase
MSTLPSHTDLLDFCASARRIAAGAAQILLDRYAQVTASLKSDGTLVTQGDEAADNYIVSQLASLYPSHVIVSEEQNTHFDPSAEYVWVIDPLDGTTNYVRGLPIWGISIALLYRGSPTIGVLSFPLLHEEYHTIITQGANRNDAPMHTATETHTSDQHFLTLCTRTPRRYQINTPLKPRILGSAAYNVITVANGSALAGIEATAKIWDVAAALLILTEAGGCYRTLESDQPIFPLSPTAADYAGRSYTILSASNTALLHELESSIVRT